MNETIIVPKKLVRGDHIRVVAPSRSMSIISNEVRDIAIDRLKLYGDFSISYGKHIEETDELNSSSIKSRVDDLHDAFQDTSVKAVLTGIGGYNTNQLLRYIDFDLIKNNPKILCGFSDITILSNAITAKTGVVTYSGPHFSSWGMKKGFDYTLESFWKACVDFPPYEIVPSKEWSDDFWFINQEDRVFIENTGYTVLQKGVGLGKSVGGHARCVSAQQGTEYFPDLEEAVLFLEEDAEISPQLFDRIVESLTQQRGFGKVKAILIGRFQKESKMTDEILRKIFKTKNIPKNIPIIANVDFGHTTPMITFPIGGVIKVRALHDVIDIKILEG